MNEHNLMIGECTCGSKVETEPEINKRIFYSAELSRVALERCKTAREAIELIGELMFTYGYYGTGETLLLGDANEAWVMEMCSYDTKNIDAIWVAKRVPDDHFFVAANEFRIRDIYINPSDQKKITNEPLYFTGYDENGKEDPSLLYSANLFKACADNEWIKPDANYLDWLPTVSDGEYGHPYYSLRRVWRALSKANSSLELPPKVENGYTRAYPFSIKPSQKLSVLDITSIYRDHYEGTEFDLTKGLAAGPYGCPVRYNDNPDLGPSEKLTGAWERPLSIYRCAMMWINQAKVVGDTQVGISWNGLDRPFTSCLLPLLSNMNKIPDLLETMNLLDFKFQGDSAWWAFNFVGNYVNLNYKYMVKDLKAPQSELEHDAHTLIQSYLSKDVFDHHDHVKLQDFCTENVYTTVNIWWELATSLIVKYNDGCITTGPNKIMEPIKYPKEWLEATGYYEGPTHY